MSDLIDRQAAIDLLKQMRKDGNMVPWEGKDVFARIRKLPSAQPERKTGLWISDVAYYDEEGCPCIVSRCNQCGEVNQETNYCPNCGARMEVEHEI